MQELQANIDDLVTKIGMDDHIDWRSKLVRASKNKKEKGKDEEITDKSKMKSKKKSKIRQNTIQS